jgi:hypothetical protein
VPTVFTQVNRNTIGTPQFGKNRRPDRIRLHRLPCLTNGGNVINVNSQFEHL